MHTNPPTFSARARRHGAVRLPRLLIGALLATLTGIGLVCCAHRDTGRRPTAAPEQSGAGHQVTNAITIVQWNVENLFDAVDDPDNPGDDEFTPASWRQWSEEHYEIKIDHLARVLATVRGDIVCLEEIENRRVLEDLNRELEKRHGFRYRHIVHRDGPDARGIDTALLTNLNVADVAWLTPVPGQRDILRATLIADGEPLTVFVNHWKSRWGGATETAPTRAAIAQVLRRAIDTVLRKNPAAAIIVAGDFNDDADDSSLVEHARITPRLKDVRGDHTGRLLYNLTGALPASVPGTFYYRHGNTWNSFDAICVSASLLPGQAVRPDTWETDFSSYTVHAPGHVTDANGYPLAFRILFNPESGRRAYQYGYSDHLAVHVTLRKRSP